jgi:hypothetical protein
VKPVNVEKVIYGKTDSKRAMTNVLQHVLEKYNFTSLSQLNAVLNLYNIHADQGSKEGRVFKHNGLNFRIVGNDGQFVGVPIKASSFYSRPTLKNLGEKFLKNSSRKEEGKGKLRMAIDMAYLQSPGMKITELGPALKKSGIDVVLRKGSKDVIYGLTFVDHRTKQVYNGGDLGKAYSAHALQHRDNLSENQTEKKGALQEIPAKEHYKKNKSGKNDGEGNIYHPKSFGGENDNKDDFDKSLVQIYLQSEYSSGSLPAALKGRKKRVAAKSVKKRV